MSVPVIDGLRFVRVLGSGGFADVFLFEQLSPRREVAVKVLRRRLDPGTIRELGAEADLLARLEHPNIVPVYATGVTSDGREYISMMFYPRGSVADRLRSGSFSVAEVLRLGVQVSGALETAHRNGILHRDVKPVNILVNQYGQPGLADFGIAQQERVSDAESESLSVPWAAPEVVAGTAPASVSSDVYSLAATLWHLLAGHSPFVVPGGVNDVGAVSVQPVSGLVPDLARGDLPDAVRGLLNQAMSVDPARRPRSAAAFAFAF